MRPSDGRKGLLQTGVADVRLRNLLLVVSLVSVVPVWGASPLPSVWTSAFPPVDVTPPKRMAKAQVIVSVSQLGGTKQVCQIEGQVAVYDVAATDELKVDYRNPLICKIDLSIGASTVSVFGMIQIVRGAAGPFAPGQKRDYKLFVGAFHVLDAEGKIRYTGPCNTVIAEDLQLKSLTHLLNDGTVSGRPPRKQDASGEGELPETVSVALRFED